MKEIWRDIPGYEGQYQVSNMGRVRSLDRVVMRKHRWGGHLVAWKYKGKILSGKPKGSGHLNVGLGANNTKLVHRLVLLAFVGEPKNGQECLHTNGNPQDNRLSNLRWGTRVENKNDERKHAQLFGRRQGSSQLSTETIRDIKQELTNPNRPSQKVLAKKYGVHVNTISNISRCFTHRWVA
jgi:hypothetical protein